MNQNQVTAKTTLTIAIPVADGRLHGHFGGCTHFELVTADRERKTILSARTVAAPPHAPGFFPRWLHGQGVNAIIAGGIGRRALELFAQQGIAVRAGQPGVPVAELVARFLDGSLSDTPAACKHHGHHHDHDHDHSHGHGHHDHHHHHGHDDSNESAH